MTRTTTGANVVVVRKLVMLSIFPYPIERGEEIKSIMCIGDVHAITTRLEADLVVLDCMAAVYILLLLYSTSVLSRVGLYFP